MKKVFMVLFIALILFGCSNAKDKVSEKDDSTTEENKTETVNTSSESETSDESKPLPFDVKEFSEKYNQYFAKMDTDSAGEIHADNTSINMALGSLSQSTAFLNTLAEVSGPDDRQNVLDITDKITNGIDKEGFYIDDKALENINISINAVDAASVTINVTAR